MLNLFLSIQHMFFLMLSSIFGNMVFLTVFSFFTIFLIRHLFFKKIAPIAVYHFALLGILFVAAMGGAGVVHDGYRRLENFIQLEKNNTLPQAEQSPQTEAMCAIDLEQFKSSDEFRAHLKGYEHAIDCAESVTIGWFFVLLSDMALLCVGLIRCIFRRPRHPLPQGQQGE